MQGSEDDASLRRFVVAYDGLAIGVTVARPTDEEWIRDVLAPAFAIRETGPAAVEVQLHVDPERFDTLRAFGRAADGALVDGAILDDSTERFESWSDDGREAQRRTAYDPLFDVFHEVFPGPFVRISAREGEVCRVALLRVVREFAMQASMRGGNVFLHAAAFAVDGRAVVIAGEKGAGKTTTLSWCLQLLPESRFIANDRIRVWCREGPEADARQEPAPAAFEVRAMPTVLSFRPAGLALLPGLEPRVRAQVGMPFHSRSEGRSRPELGPVKPFTDGRIGLSPTRYPELLGRESIAAAPAAAIVFPEVAGDDAGVRASRLPVDTAVAGIVRALFGAAALDRQSELFSLAQAGDFPTPAELRRRAARIAREVPSYRWEVGRGAVRDESGLRRFLASL